MGIGVLPFTVPVPDAVLVTALVVAAITDLRVGRIFNALTYPTILFGLAAALVWGRPPLVDALAGGLVGGGCLYVFFLCGWIGGGDVKLMAAVGAVKGLPFVLNAMFYSVFFAGVCAAVILIWRGQIGAVAGDVTLVARRAMGDRSVPLSALPSRAGSFPFGVAIGFGTIVALGLA